MFTYYTFSKLVVYALAGATGYCVSHMWSNLVNYWQQVQILSYGKVMAEVCEDTSIVWMIHIPDMCHEHYVVLL